MQEEHVWTLHKGRLVHLTGNPGLEAAPQALREHAPGALLVDPGGRVRTSGNAAGVEAPPGARVLDHSGCILLPGFVDTHLHFPQVLALDRHAGGGLLGWLERCIFPEEARLQRAEHAALCAKLLCDALLSSGTTTAMIFGSRFPRAQARLFQELEHRGLRAVVGRTVMLRGPAAARELVTDEETALELCREEIAARHQADPRGLIHVALAPRFALSMTRRGLQGLGELYAEHRSRGVYVTTHLSESRGLTTGDVERVRRVFGVPACLDVFDGRFLPGGAPGGPSLLGRRTVMAHAVHATGGELRRLHRAGSGVAHCPVSQLFLGSGTLPWRRTRASGVRLALGTDVGAGDTFSIPGVMNACFKVHVSAGRSQAARLHPAELLHLGTLGGAQVLDKEALIGNLDPGKEADFVVVDPSRSPGLAARLAWLEERGATSAERLFTLLMGMDPGCVKETWVAGRRVMPGP